MINSVSEGFRLTTNFIYQLITKEAENDRGRWSVLVRKGAWGIEVGEADYVTTDSPRPDYNRATFKISVLCHVSYQST